MNETEVRTTERITQPRVIEKKGFNFFKKIISSTGERTQRPERAPLSEDEKKVRDLFLLSFRFSQGNDLAQEEIYYWLQNNNHLKNLPIPRVAPSYILELSVPKDHGEIKKRKTSREFKKQWEKLYQISNKQERSSDEQLLASLLVERDLKYQQSRRRTPVGKTSPVPDSSYDPHVSLVRKYGYKHKSTGCNEYDTMFRALEPYFSKSFYFDEMEERWEENHPEEQFFPKESANQN